MASSSFAFWNFVEFFPPNIYNLQLVESTDEEFTDMKGWLYTSTFVSVIPYYVENEGQEENKLLMIPLCTINCASYFTQIILISK